ncbi:ethanolaminephosphotransferase (ETHPT) 9 transmembrane domain involved in lipid metabolism [Cryptosporidium xiaoi]|uniref:Ethanolaminephosphotransferase (ETHPT) 9 transmembrane domain involved in lipid metabolism n=1 Tax=Cryptosporidium xiaoi TaxID=659607 RepID=A0AAV9XZF6_9CRYT
MIMYIRRRNSKNGIFGRYITENGLKNIESYCYKSTGSTFMDSLMNPFWESFEKIIPVSVSPNLLTIFGFLCSLFAQIIISIHCPTLNCQIPINTSLVIGFLLFLYQTLDAVDGKHARRLNISSPLGQLLDHGLDSFTTIFFTNIFSTACRMGWGYKYFAFLTIVQLKLLSFIWLENHCKVFRCSSSNYLGVTESQTLIILFLIFSSIFGAKISSYQLFFNIKFLDIFILILIFTGIYTLINDIKAGFGTFKTSIHRWNASLEICGTLCHVLFQVLFLFSDVCVIYPNLCIFIITTSTSAIALKMNVSSFTQEQLPFIHWPLIPFYFSSVILLFGNIIIDHFSEFQFLILIFISIWNTLYIFDFSIVIINSICDRLKISFLGTKSRIKQVKHTRLRGVTDSEKLESYSISRSSKKKY